ncbi:proteasome-type protease [Chitinimonas sp.]|uniref:proteasome-type protease n=1 Tax=Chitinimonas sp. TaxID=1934313 RepID=UPI002F93DA94
MRLKAGLLFASDSRTNAGVDHIATFRKMHLFELPGQRLIVLLSAGNLATTQSVVSLLRQRLDFDAVNLHNVSTLYDAATLVGNTVKEVVARDAGTATQSQGVDFGANFLVGGQIRGEGPRLFHIYPQGNFIEAGIDTPYFQIGESKYGKPIIDRVVDHDTSLAEAAKCTLISFDSTIRSNLSVGLPIDMLMYERDSFTRAAPHRIDADDPYFNKLRKEWGSGLRRVFGKLPDADWFGGTDQRS